MVEQMKPSGIDWIGDIPQSWLIGRVKNFYKILTGFTPDTSNPEYYDDDLGYDWITIADIDNAKYITETKSKISQKYLQEKHPIITPKGSLLYSFKLSVGKVAFAGKDIYTNEAIASFVEDKNVSLKFLYYSSALIIENANINIYGAKIMNQELIGNAPIVFPTLEEQRFIADFLDKQCGKLDGIISDLEKQIETLQKYKKSLILETVTKGLNKNAPMKPSGIDWIGDIPAHWDIKRIKDVSKMQTGTTPPNNEGVNIDGDGVNWFTPGDFIDGSIELSNSEKFVNDETIQRESIKVYPKHSILFVGIASIGKLGYFEKACYSNQQITAIKSNNIESSKYIAYSLLASMDYTKSNALYTTVPIINNAYLGVIKIPFPEVKEQKEIVGFLDKKCSQIDVIVQDKQEQLEKIKQHKKSLIYEYVTGKKRVKEASNGN